MKLAVVLVHYHTPELLRRASRALLRDAEASGLALETLVVDNGSAPREKDLLASLPARCLDPGCNLGYAGGVNLGVRESAAELVVAMNPDVEVIPGCLAALVAALESGAAAAGPRFWWDSARTFLLPPTEPVSRRAELLAVLARRGGFWARLARRRWRRHARRYWRAEEPLAGYDLSGALLAFRREAWLAAGPLDEGYHLYFEETDWLRRLRAARLPARFVPAAEAVHLYAQSTVAEPNAKGWLSESARRFRRSAYGAGFTRLLERWSARTPPPGQSAAEASRPARPAAWLEVSSTSAGYPAAGRRLSTDTALSTSLPEEIWSRLAPGTYALRSVDEAGRELAVRFVEKARSSQKRSPSPIV